MSKSNGTVTIPKSLVPSFQRVAIEADALKRGFAMGVDQSLMLFAASLAVQAKDESTPAPVDIHE